MPTWLKCRDCGEVYYTACDKKDIKEYECEKCGGRLVVRPRKKKIKKPAK